MDSYELGNFVVTLMAFLATPVLCIALMISEARSDI